MSQAAVAAWAAGAELFRALAVLAEPPGDEHRTIAHALALPVPGDVQRWRADHTETFVFRLYPYASVYLGVEGMLGGEARDRIAGFWRALGQTAPAEPDHLPVLLAAYAELIDRSVEDRRWLSARRALLGEHLLSWLAPWLARMPVLGTEFYAAWADLLHQALAQEIELIGVPRALPLHLRAAPPLADPRRDSGERFITGLLAPAVSGMILVREDLQQAARDRALGSRVGERRFMLRTLLSQDPAACLDWLSRWAQADARAHAVRPALCEHSARHWQARAERTRRLLQSLRVQARAGQGVGINQAADAPQPG